MRRHRTGFIDRRKHTVTTTRVILQARTGSTRLPAKVLLPVGGLPLVVLAARRAANTGLSVVVATSDTAEDQCLAATVEQAGIRCVRGSLENVLERFLGATDECDDATQIVRLTADNVFPDGRFVEELCARFQQQGGDYLGTHSPADGLPYGLSAEVFRLGALRRIAAAGADAADREHVTVSLRRGTTPFRPGELVGDFSHLRCTVDSYDDYQRAVAILAGVEDPVRVSWAELLQRLERNYPEPQLRLARGGPTLVLGSAQLGLPHYGRTNRTGQLPRTSALQLVRGAVTHGVREFDTARAYGEAEELLGAAVVGLGSSPRLITKLDPLAELKPEDRRDAVRIAVEASVFRSCRELRRNVLPVVLLHRWSHRNDWQGAVWERLVELQTAGVIERLGASVSTPAEAAAALADAAIQHLQFPFNLLDHRWRSAGIDELARQRPDVAIHVRSVFLQGLLLNSAEFWPSIPGVDPADLLARLDDGVSRLGRQDRMDLCLAYVRSQPWIHGVVVGVDSSLQLLEIIGHFRRASLPQAVGAELAAEFAGLPEALLNPALWPARSGQ